MKDPHLPELCAIRGRLDELDRPGGDFKLLGGLSHWAKVKSMFIRFMLALYQAVLCPFFFAGIWG
jgi:hypothetical protein